MLASRQPPADAVTPACSRPRRGPARRRGRGRGAAGSPPPARSPPLGCGRPPASRGTEHSSASSRWATVAARRARPSGGNVLKLHRVKGNLEDVAVHTPSGRLVLLAEKKGELVVWDPGSASELARFPIDMVGVLGKEPADRNQGFEGLAFREDSGEPGGGTFYLVHQRKPARLVALSLRSSGPRAHDRRRGRRRAACPEAVRGPDRGRLERARSGACSSSPRATTGCCSSRRRGPIDATLSASRWPPGGPGLRPRGRAVDRRRPPGAVSRFPARCEALERPRRGRLRGRARAREPAALVGLALCGAASAQEKPAPPPEGWKAEPFSIETRPPGSRSRSRAISRPTSARSWTGRWEMAATLAACRRVRVAAPADRLRGRVAQAGVRARRRPGLRQGRRAQGRAAGAAFLEGARDRRRPHQAAGEPGVADLRREDRRHRTRRARGFARAGPRLGRPDPGRARVRASSTRRGSSRATPHEPQPRRHHRGRSPAAQAVGMVRSRGLLLAGRRGRRPGGPGLGPEPEGPRRARAARATSSSPGSTWRASPALGHGRSPSGRSRARCGASSWKRARSARARADAGGPAGRLRQGLVRHGHVAPDGRAKGPHRQAAQRALRGPGSGRALGPLRGAVVRRREQPRLRGGREPGREHPPGGIRTFTGGLSWWPTTFLRLQGNVLLERYDDTLRAPEPGNDGDYVSLLGRVQVHLP